jgi:hypothetical protein
VILYKWLYCILCTHLVHFTFDKVFVTDIVLCCIRLCNCMTISVSLVLVTYEDEWNKNKLLLLLLLLLLLVNSAVQSTLTANSSIVL